MNKNHFFEPNNFMAILNFEVPITNLSTQAISVIPIGTT
jgi:hypothetical protein